MEVLSENKVEMVKEFFRRFISDLGYSPTPEHGRTADINRRLAKIMGKELQKQSPAEEYASYQALAKPLKKKKARKADKDNATD